MIVPEIDFWAILAFVTNYYVLLDKLTTRTWKLICLKIEANTSLLFLLSS